MTGSSCAPSRSPVAERAATICWGLVLLSGLFASPSARGPFQPSTSFQSERKADHLDTPAESPLRFFVDPSGSDSSAGTRSHPFRTLERARRAVRTYADRTELPETGIHVVLKPGVYRRTHPFRLGPEDSGRPGRPVVYRGASDGVILSGGRRIENWRRVGDSLWTTRLPDVREDRWYFRQLFAGGVRMPRAREPDREFFRTAGPLSKYADVFSEPYQFDRAARLRDHHPDAFCGFSYREGDLEKWETIEDAEVITYHSWECSWQPVRSIDTADNQIHFFTPTRYPVGFFGDHLRYRVENVRSALDEPGEWYLDRSSGQLYVLAEPGRSPEDIPYVAPVAHRILEITGETDGVHAGHIRFENLEIRHTRYRMGHYDTAPNWPEPIRAVLPSFPRSFPPGYSGSQAAPHVGTAVHVERAESVVLRNCRLRMLGGYAIHLARFTRESRIEDCRLTDLGGGGVMIGVDVRNVQEGELPEAAAPRDHLVRNNRILYGGRRHPAAVGIGVAQSRDVTLRHNEIGWMPYSGISIGWTWGSGPNYTDHVRAERNHIHHVVRELADGGGIYTLGRLQHTVLEANHIHDVERPAGAVGAENNGLFFDQGSAAVTVRENVIHSVSGRAVRFNDSGFELHRWGANSFESTSPGEDVGTDLDVDPMSLAAIRRVVRSAGPRTDTSSTQ